MERRSSIQQKLLTVIMFTSGTVVLLTCLAFFAYEVLTFRQSIVDDLSTLGKIISRNSTASLAFRHTEDAEEILEALKAEPHILEACLYDEKMKPFAVYTKSGRSALPATFPDDGYYIESSYVFGFEPVIEDNKRLGTLFVKADLEAMHERLILYAYMAISVILLSFLVAFLLSKLLQKKITDPILSLANTAHVVSRDKDYSTRAVKYEDDEIGFLTDAFNQMLAQIQQQTDEITLFNTTLEKKVKERTLQLELANQELEAFSYSVSHDLRAPLRHIRAHVDMFKDQFIGNIPSPGRIYIENVERNARRMNQLIDDLLTYSQMSKKELIKEKVPIQQIVTDICEELSRQNAHRKITIDLGPLPPAFADLVSVKQLWMNLISNAFKYTGHREETFIEIGSKDGNNEIIYYIKDNGAGFDMEFYNKLFVAFQRLHTQKEFEGTGVGLAIVERIVRRHGGRIWAEGQPGAGATFYFTIPKNGERL